MANRWESFGWCLGWCLEGTARHLLSSTLEANADEAGIHRRRFGFVADGGFWRKLAAVSEEDFKIVLQALRIGMRRKLVIRCDSVYDWERRVRRIRMVCQVFGENTYLRQVDVEIGETIGRTLAIVARKMRQILTLEVSKWIGFVDDETAKGDFNRFAACLRGHPTLQSLVFRQLPARFLAVVASAVSDVLPTMPSLTSLKLYCRGGESLTVDGPEALTALLQLDLSQLSVEINGIPSSTGMFPDHLSRRVIGMARVKKLTLNRCLMFDGDTLEFGNWTSFLADDIGASLQDNAFGLAHHPTFRSLVFKSIPSDLLPPLVRVMTETLPTMPSLNSLEFHAMTGNGITVAGSEALAELLNHDLSRLSVKLHGLLFVAEAGSGQPFYNGVAAARVKGLHLVGCSFCDPSALGIALAESDIRDTVVQHVSWSSDETDGAAFLQEFTAHLPAESFLEILDFHASGLALEPAQVAMLVDRVAGSCNTLTSLSLPCIVYQENIEVLDASLANLVRGKPLVKTLAVSCIGKQHDQPFLVLHELVQAILDTYGLTQLILLSTDETLYPWDSRILPSVEGCLVMNRAGRVYLMHNAGDKAAGLPVLQSVINDIGWLMFHFKENPMWFRELPGQRRRIDEDDGNDGAGQQQRRRLDEEDGGDEPKRQRVGSTTMAMMELDNSSVGL